MIFAGGKDKRQHVLLDSQVISRLSRLSVCARKPLEGNFSGRHKSPHRGASVEFAQYRKYTPGEDIRSLDWRVYGRTDRFYVKEFEADTNLRAYLVLDCSNSMAFAGRHGSKFGLAQQLSAMLSYMLISQGDAVGLHCFNENVLKHIPPRTNPKHLHALLTTLEDLHPAGTTDLKTVLHELAENIGRRALVIVISDFFTDVTALLDCFQHLLHRRHDLAVLHVMDEAELQFDFSRPVRFIDLEDGHGTLTDPSIIKSQYLRLMHEFLESLRIGCLECGADYYLATPDAGCEAILSNFLLGRMQKK